MSLTSTDPIVVETIDDMLRVIADVRLTKPRDPFSALEDRLLDMRRQVTA